MKISVVYWSASGNTQAMAEAIAEGINSGGAEAVLLSVSEASDFNADDYDKIAFGCPAMGDEALEETEFEPFFTGIEGSLKNKEIALFGSYGWGDGEWMRSWQERVSFDNAKLFEEGLIACGAADFDECFSFGERFAKA
jgi:flavodoxin short chain